MSAETELLRHIGTFGEAVVAFMLLLLVPAVLYALKKITDDNSKFHERSFQQQVERDARILDAIKEIVIAIKEYREEVKEFKSESLGRLEKHDDQAACIKKTVGNIDTTLQNRPCIAKNGRAEL
jgi:uncharacterized membrane protein YhiD involved in acid resistance